MNTELQALLIVQQDDEVIRAIETRRDALAPRLATLDKARKRAADEVSRTDGALERELEKHRSLEARIVEHKLRHDKNVEVLNSAQKLKEVTAAAAQVEATRKVLADEESESLAISRRIVDLRNALAVHREVLERTSADQEAARSTLAAELAVIDKELGVARGKRNKSSEGVGRSLLSKYDRVQARRRTIVVFQLHDDFSCGSCDTSIPLQRRLPMSTGAIIEPCEGCGCLLYYIPAPPAPPQAPQD
ncbi:zinc ribbon domain-containing protein [Gemmatimonas sp.]|uniref:zinc ribbon domain-containing protein n=1 Tax=Gemmatimonas sp. TaxID=1962908 RepID=UPI003983BE41